MTQRRNDPDRLSNHFDDLLRGVGHRGSSFTDVDALTHDEQTDRFLFQEFKRHDEELNKGQARVLKGLARRDYITVWCVRLRQDGDLDWCDVASRCAETITSDEYKDRFRRWWNQEPPRANVTVMKPQKAPNQPGKVTPMMSDEIEWSRR